MTHELPADCAARFRVEAGSASASLPATERATGRACVVIPGARPVDVEHPGLAAAIAHGPGWVAYAEVGGTPLSESGPLPLAQALPLLRQLLAALTALHDAGLAHGDVRAGARLAAGRVKLAGSALAGTQAQDLEDARAIAATLLATAPASVRAVVSHPCTSAAQLDRALSGVAAADQIPAPVIATLALAAALATGLFALKPTIHLDLPRPPPAVRPSPVAAWPVLLEALPDGVRLELAPRDRDLTLTVLEHRKKGPPKEVATRPLPRTEGPVDVTGLQPETDHTLLLTARGAPVLPPQIRFSTRPPRAGLELDLPKLLALADDLDPRETDRVAALWRAAPRVPPEAHPHGRALATRMRSRALLAALVDRAPAELPAGESLALAALALDLGDRDRSATAWKRAREAGRASGALPDSAAFAQVALALEGPAAMPRAIAALEAAPPADPARAARALATAPPDAVRPAAERWLAHPRLSAVALEVLAATATDRVELLTRLWRERPALAAGCARHLTDTGLASARLAVYALARPALADPALIWEVARTVASETASDASRAAVSGIGAALVALSRAGEPAAREAATAALGLVPADAAVAALGEAVHGGPPRVAAAAAWALVTRRERAHVAALLDLACSERDPQGVAAWACGMLATRDAAPRLAEALSRTPRDRSQLSRRLLLGFALARLANDGRGWQALDDERTDIPFGHFLAHQVHAGPDTIWLFPFVGLAPVTGRLMSGQALQAQPAGWWCDGPHTYPATRSDPLALSLELGPRSVPLGLTPVTAVCRGPAPAVVRLTPSGSSLSGCVAVRVRLGEAP